MPKRLKLTFISLRISEVLYGLLALFFVFFFGDLVKADPEGLGFGAQDQIILSLLKIFTAGFSIAFIAFIEIVVRSLKKARYWAWIAAIIICGFYCTNLLFFLGIPGLVGLLSKETRTYF